MTVLLRVAAVAGALGGALGGVLGVPASLAAWQEIYEVRGACSGQAIFSSGWWFETFIIFPYIGNNHPNWIIFFRWVETTNQFIWGFSWKWMEMELSPSTNRCFFSRFSWDLVGICGDLWGSNHPTYGYDGIYTRKHRDAMKSMGINNDGWTDEHSFQWILAASFFKLFVSSQFDAFADESLRGWACICWRDNPIVFGKSMTCSNNMPPFIFPLILSSKTSSHTFRMEFTLFTYCSSLNMCFFSFFWTCHSKHGNKMSMIFLFPFHFGISCSNVLVN